MVPSTMRSLTSTFCGLGEALWLALEDGLGLPAAAGRDVIEVLDLQGLDAHAVAQQHAVQLQAGKDLARRGVFDGAVENIVRGDSYVLRRGLYAHQSKARHVDVVGDDGDRLELVAKRGAGVGEARHLYLWWVGQVRVGI